ncbi:hypothetical protein E2542_SST25290 [Spatholobus suberectus]|nr:hypothetical protein E2542_SST25290 [Spatholobus suberectus]
MLLSPRALLLCTRRHRPSPAPLHTAVIALLLRQSHTVASPFTQPHQQPQIWKSKFRSGNLAAKDFVATTVKVGREPRRLVRAPRVPHRFRLYRRFRLALSDEELGYEVRIVTVRDSADGKPSVTATPPLPLWSLTGTCLMFL